MGSLAQPGKPAVYYVGVQGAGKGAPAAGSKSPPAAGKKPAGGASGDTASRGAKVEPIKDLKKLDDHLSTRSYVAGGHMPTAADAAQLGAIQLNVSEDYPHAARWQRHISSFSPAQRAKW